MVQPQHRRHHYLHAGVAGDRVQHNVCEHRIVRREKLLAQRCGGLWSARKLGQQRLARGDARGAAKGMVGDGEDIAMRSRPSVREPHVEEVAGELHGLKSRDSRLDRRLDHLRLRGDAEASNLARSHQLPQRGEQVVLLKNAHGCLMQEEEVHVIRA